MKIFFAVLLCATSTCCTGKRGNTKQIDLEKQSYDSLPKKRLVIKDEDMYSVTFINSLREFMDYRNDSVIKLLDSLIVTPEYKTSFPRYPKLNEHYTLAASRNDGGYYELKIHRINYSDLDFTCTIKSGQEVLYETKGIAILSPGFIMAADSYDDEVTGGAYDAYQYSSDAGDCAISFVIGNTGPEKALLGKIKDITCGNSKVREMIERMPTLRVRMK